MIDKGLLIQVEATPLGMLEMMIKAINDMVRDHLSFINDMLDDMYQNKRTNMLAKRDYFISYNKSINVNKSIKKEPYRRIHLKIPCQCFTNTFKRCIM